jgi:AraC-like DNA-binding protein
MTEAASELSLDANRQPMVLAGTVRGSFELAVATGLDRAGLLARMGLTAEALADLDRPVPLEAQTAIWEALAELPNAETLALTLAEAATVALTGVVGWLIRHAPNVRAMLESIGRYRALWGDPFVPTIDDAPDRVIVHRVFEPRIARTRVMPEYAPASTIALIRQLTQGAPDAPLALEVWFQHAPPRDSSAHEAFFGCPVRFDAPETRLVLARAAVERPVVGRDAGLYAYLDRHALSLVEKLSSTAPKPSLADRVRAELTTALAQGEPTQAQIAQKLATSERTLQRRLKAEGHTFAELLDDVRAALARRYLTEPTLAASEVGFLLGYSEPSSFHRAFKRWAGESPIEFRRRYGVRK